MAQVKQMREVHVVENAPFIEVVNNELIVDGHVFSYTNCVDGGIIATTVNGRDGWIHYDHWQDLELKARDLLEIMEVTKKEKA